MPYFSPSILDQEYPRDLPFIMLNMFNSTALQSTGYVGINGFSPAHIDFRPHRVVGYTIIINDQFDARWTAGSPTTAITFSIYKNGVSVHSVALIQSDFTDGQATPVSKFFNVDSLTIDYAVGDALETTVQSGAGALSTNGADFVMIVKSVSNSWI